MISTFRSVAAVTVCSFLLATAAFAEGDAAHGELQACLAGLAHGLLAGGLALATAAHGAGWLR